MRLTSDFWVSAFLRQENATGAFAMVERKGAAEAGAIIIIQYHRDGTYSAYQPAPQTEAVAGDRRFERVMTACTREDIDTWVQRQLRFDSDVWVIETDRRETPPTLDIV